MAKSTKELTPERLREVLHYDPEAGVFTWRRSNGRRARAGAPAGHRRVDGLSIGVDGTLYRATRLAWLYMTEKWPEHPVHFRNECPTDLRWENLYELPLGAKLTPFKKTRRDGPLTAERLRELLHYDPDTGIFTRRVTLGVRSKAGEVTGTLTDRGYVTICVDARGYRAHRLAWMYVYGEWPEDQIDHIDGNRANNSIRNLRPATNPLNHANRGPQKNNTSGYKGVYWLKRDKKWLAKIVKNGRQIHLGRFDDPEEASLAYEKATQSLNGEFGRSA